MSTGAKRSWTYVATAAAAALIATAGYWAFADRADLARGAELYAECTGCHAPQQVVVGPPHCKLFGRRAGSVADYPYSEAMKNSAIVWDAKTLDGFLRAPLEYVRGTNMGYAGLANPDDRRDLIGYLKETTGQAAFCAQAAG